MAEEQDPGPEEDDLVKVLSNPANQAVVSYFNNSPSNTTTFGELSKFLDENLPGEKDTSATLQHTCLPELSYYGLLEYDAEHDTVEVLQPEELQSLHEYVDQSEIASD